MNVCIFIMFCIGVWNSLNRLLVRSEVCSLPQDDPKVGFVYEAVGQLVRLSVWDRVAKTLPENFQIFLPGMQLGSGLCN